MIGWASDMSIDIPRKTSINPNIPTTRLIIEFNDRFMKNTSKFTSYDASEEAFYVLFTLCLVMHPQTPSVLAIDSFDQSINPRLAKKITQVFCDEVLKNKKHVFMTTDKPFVLDGLDLRNEDIRLFIADRNKKGYADIKKIQVSEQLINEGQPLSRIWISGRLEGVLD